MDLLSNVVIAESDLRFTWCFGHFRYLRALHQGAPVLLKMFKEVGTSTHMAIFEEEIRKEVALKESLLQYPEGSNFLVVGLGVYRWTTKTCIVLDALYGATLNHFLLQQPHPHHGLDAETCVRYVQEILCGLAFLQQKELIHGNINGNSIVCHNNRWKIEDLSLACKFPCPPEHVGKVARSSSAYHCAPEVLLGSGLSFKSDSYSLGCVIYELFCGELLTSRLSQAALQTKIKTWPRFQACVKLCPDLIRNLLACLKDEVGPRPVFQTMLQAKGLSHPLNVLLIDDPAQYDVDPLRELFESSLKIGCDAPSPYKHPEDDDLKGMFDGETSLMSSDSDVSDFPTSLEILNLGMESQSFSTGSCGLVFRAQMSNGEPVVVKYPKDLQSQKLLMKEAHLLVSVNHPNIIKIKGLYLFSESHVPMTCIVLEYAQHHDLRGYLNSPRSIPKEVKHQWAISIADAMAYLTGAKIAHRDLKSLNILVFEDSDNGLICKIGDFGFGRVITKDDSILASNLGTQRWVAPEILLADPYLPSGKAKYRREATDVYSFGVLLWEIFTREIPWFGFDLETIKRHLIDNRCLPIPEDASPEFHSLLRTMWRREPEKRPSFNEVLYQLRAMRSSDLPADTIPTSNLRPANVVHGDKSSNSFFS